MPPDIDQRQGARSEPPRTVDTMDDSFDLVAENAPGPQQDLLTEPRLTRMFELQQENIRVALQEELNKRIPSAAASATNEKPGSILGILSHFARGPANQNSQEAIDQLLRRNDKLERANESLNRDMGAAKKQNHKLRDDMNAARQDLFHERAKNEELKKRMTSLRQMLIPPSEDQVSDTEVIQKFISLRSLIFRLVRTTWAKKFRDDIDERNLSEGQVTFARSYIGKDAMWKSLYHRIRYFIFYQLCMSVLDRRLYGLAKDFRRLDQQLEAIEIYLWEGLPEGERGMLMDWRIATMKVTEHLRDDQRSVAGNVQHQIWDFLSMFDTNGPEAEKKGYQMLEQICNDAVDLGMLMRKAKDDLYVDIMDSASGRPISEWETFVDEEASEAAESGEVQSQTIAYIITGALVKHPKENPQEKKVLEKAQAVVYK